MAAVRRKSMKKKKQLKEKGKYENEMNESNMKSQENRQKKSKRGVAWSWLNICSKLSRRLNEAEGSAELSNEAERSSHVYFSYNLYVTAAQVSLCL